MQPSHFALFDEVDSEDLDRKLYERDAGEIRIGNKPLIMTFMPNPDASKSGSEESGHEFNISRAVETRIG